MKYYRAELVYDKAPDDGEDPQRYVPRRLRLVDPDTGEKIEIPGIRQVSMSFGLTDIRVLKLELIVSGVDEVTE